MSFHIDNIPQEKFESNMTLLRISTQNLKLGSGESQLNVGSNVLTDQIMQSGQRESSSMMLSKINGRKDTKLGLLFANQAKHNASGYFDADFD